MLPNTGLLSMSRFDTPDDAPKYNSPEFKQANMNEAVVVMKGTVKGNPTVDLIFVDETGQKYVAMLNGSLIVNLAAMVGPIL